MSNTTITVEAVHVFEAAGLGKAPFRFVGMEDTAANAGPDGMVRTAHNGIDHLTKPGGTCDFCGHYIVVFCWILSADGRRFKVGTDCVAKTGDKGLKKIVDRKARELANAKRHAREAARIAEAKATLDRADVRRVLRDEPHPRAWRAEQGDTREDWADWMMANAGTKGRLQVAAAVAKIAADLDAEADEALAEAAVKIAADLDAEADEALAEAAVKAAPKAAVKAAPKAVAAPAFVPGTVKNAQQIPLF